MGNASDLHRITRIRREALRQITLLEEGDEGLPSLDELARAVLQQMDDDAVPVVNDCN